MVSEAGETTRWQYFVHVWLPPVRLVNNVYEAWRKDQKITMKL